MTNITRTLVATCAAIAFAPAAALANTAVRDNLNAADTAFRHGLDGCTNVSVAITAAGNPAVFGGPATAQQRQELATYAKRCNLRF